MKTAPKKETLKVFQFRLNKSYAPRGTSGIVLAYGKGHAVKLLAKQLEEKGMVLEKEDFIEEIDPASPLYRKGTVFFL